VELTCSPESQANRSISPNASVLAQPSTHSGQLAPEGGRVLKKLFSDVTLFFLAQRQALSLMRLRISNFQTSHGRPFGTAELTFRYADFPRRNLASSRQTIAVWPSRIQLDAWIVPMPATHPPMAMQKINPFVIIPNGHEGLWTRNAGSRSKGLSRDPGAGAGGTGTLFSRSMLWRCGFAPRGRRGGQLDCGVEEMIGGSDQ